MLLLMAFVLIIVTGFWFFGVDGYQDWFNFWDELRERREAKARRKKGVYWWNQFADNVRQQGPLSMVSLVVSVIVLILVFTR